MRTRPALILAGAAALGGAALFIPTVAAQPAVPSAHLVIDCTEDGSSHTYTASVENPTDGSITVNDDANLAVTPGTSGALQHPGDFNILAGGTYTYPTAVPLAADGDQAVTAVFTVSWGETTNLAVTATAEPCTSTPTTEAPTTTTSTPAVQAAVDFTG